MSNITEPDVFFHNVRLLEPAHDLDQIGSLLVRDGKIADLGHHIGQFHAVRRCRPVLLQTDEMHPRQRKQWRQTIRMH